MKRLSIFWLVILLGCVADPNPSIHFVVPDGHRGAVELILDPADGVDIPLKDGRYTVQVPLDAKLRLRSFKIFEGPHTEYARYRNGKVIPTGFEAHGRGEIPANETGFRDTGMHEGTRYPHRTIVYVIGTQPEADTIMHR